MFFACLANDAGVVDLARDEPGVVASPVVTAACFATNFRMPLRPAPSQLALPARARHVGARVTIDVRHDDRFDGLHSDPNSPFEL